MDVADQLVGRLQECTGFEWDEGNAVKNWRSHRVNTEEAESVFFNEPLVVADDSKHSDREPRYFALGQTANARRLFVVFTIRDRKIRIISARDMSRKERDAYASHEEEEANS